MLEERRISIEEVMAEPWPMGTHSVQISPETIMVFTVPGVAVEGQELPDNLITRQPDYLQLEGANG